MGKKKNKQYPKQSRNASNGRESMDLEGLRLFYGMEKIEEKVPIQYEIAKKDKLNNHYFYDDQADFINPYNFISLGDGVERKQNKKGELTGYIDCELVTKTPLIIPGKITKEVNKHKYYDAFVVDNHPVIPGSSLRGAIRSQFETLSHSCLSTIDEEMRFTTRAEDFFQNVGLLYKDKFIESKVIYMDFKKFGYSLDSQRCLVKDGKIYKTGDPFYILTERSQDVYKGDREFVSYISHHFEEHCSLAYLFIGETHPSNDNDKHKYVKLCIVKDNEVEIPCCDVSQLRKDYFTVLKEYRDAKKNKAKDHHFYENSRIHEESEVIPVWYNMINESIYVSPAQRGRFAYNRVIKDLLKVNTDKTSYEPCSDETHICSACSLFGTVHDNLKIPSRIRISDAITENKKCIEQNYRTLVPLSSPKFSNPEFYLDYIKNRERKSYDIFNYDYSVFNGDNVLIDSKNLLIRGRKYYWHFYPTNTNHIEKNQMNASYKAIKEQTTFHFKVYFDEITEEELNQLIITLNLEDNENNQCYKIGHGKPLGYGSCKIKVNDVKYRNISIHNNKIQYEIKNYHERYHNFEEAFGKQDRLYYEVRTMTNFNYLIDKKVPVSYPIGDGIEKESFRWFILNKECVSTGTTAKTTNINQLLPFVSDEYDKIVMKGYYSNKKRGKTR